MECVILDLINAELSDFLSERERAAQSRCKFRASDCDALQIRNLVVSNLLEKNGIWEWVAPNIGFNDPPWDIASDGSLVVASWDDSRDLHVKSDGSCFAVCNITGACYFMAATFVDLLRIFWAYERNLTPFHVWLRGSRGEALNIELNVSAFEAKVIEIDPKAICSGSFWRHHLNWILLGARDRWFWSNI